MVKLEVNNCKKTIYLSGNQFLLTTSQKLALVFFENKWHWSQEKIVNTLLVIEKAIIKWLHFLTVMGCYKFILFRFLGTSLKLLVKPQQIIIKLSPKGRTVFQQMAHVAQMSLRFEVYFSMFWWININLLSEPEGLLCALVKCSC